MNRNIIIFLLLSILAGALYVGTIHYPFQFDDEHVIQNNELLDNSANILRFFTKAGMEGGNDERLGSYRPFLFASYAFNYLASGPDPAAYRLTDIFLHILNGFLLFLIIHLILKGVRDPWPWSLIAACIFVVHPVQTEAVIYISARSVVLLTSLCLASLFFYLKYRENGKAFWLFASASFFGFALLTKESSLPFLFILILIELAVSTRQDIPQKGFSWKAISAFIAITTAYLPLRWFFIIKAQTPGIDTDLLNHWTVSISVLPRYILMAVLPAGLSVDHAPPAFQGLGNIYFILGVLIAAAAVATTALLYRKDRLLAALFAWPFLASLVEAIFPVTDKFVEYRLYLPMAGAAAFIATLLSGRWFHLSPKMAKPLFIAGLATIVIMSAASFERSRVWASQITLWQDAIEKDPLNPRPYNNLGSYLINQGDDLAATVYLERALKLNPGYTYAYANLGNAYYNMARFPEAIKNYKRALQLNPRHFQVNYNLAVIYLKLGRTKDAVNICLNMIRIFPERKDAPEIAASLFDDYGLPSLAKEFRKME